jgi:hypothetical protein
MNEVSSKMSTRPELNTVRLGPVYEGQWAIHTPSGQIGEIVDWTENALMFRVHGSTAGNGSDKSGQGFVTSDNKHHFRKATALEVRGYVLGNWDWQSTQAIEEAWNIEDPKNLVGCADEMYAAAKEQKDKVEEVGATLAPADSNRDSWR